jgi:hypothetical protein
MISCLAIFILYIFFLLFLFLEFDMIFQKEHDYFSPFGVPNLIKTYIFLQTSVSYDIIQ